MENIHAGGISGGVKGLTSALFHNQLLNHFTPGSDQQGLPPCIIHTFKQRGNEQNIRYDSI